ncbi:MAG TPA: PLP-dependent aspartate aminotransferase family protein [Thermoanaerobaculia bacterium]|nr:PLP-dependent aspartate aminotransferase family protein [Thermoanaerobaculia bacterium]
MNHAETTAIHAGRSDFAKLGCHAPPIDLSTTYPVDDLETARESLNIMAHGGQPEGNSVYARLHNPTVARFEEALARLEQTEEAVAFGSGMAALTACLLAARFKRQEMSKRTSLGEHVVAVRPIYGTSDHLLSNGLLGMTTTWTQPDTISEAVRPGETILVVIETPANPTISLVDIEDVVRQAGDIPVLVDSTFATPVLQNPCSLGASFTLHSATKFLGGYGDVIAGVVATSSIWARALRHVRVVTGALLHPLAGYLLHRGLTTLAVRVKAAQESAQILALRLKQHPAVKEVGYPGLLPCGPAAETFKRQMKGPGALVAFEIRGETPEEECRKATQLLDRLQLISHAVSLGATDTLLQHPASLTHFLVPRNERLASGITDGLLRLSVGLENVEDLWQDLRQALDSM